MQNIHKLAVLLAIPITLYLFWTNAISTSADTIGSEKFTYGMALFALAISIYSIYLLIKKSATRNSVTAIIFLVFLMAFISLASSNCARCITQDSRSRAPIVFALEDFYRANGTYPSSLLELPSDDLKVDTSNFQYTRTEASYQLCSLIRIPFFLGIQTGRGEEQCWDSPFR